MEYRRATKKDIPEIVGKRIAYLIEHHGGLSAHYIDDLIPKLTKYFQKHLNKNITAYLASEDSRHAVSIAMLLTTEKPARPSFMNGRTGIVLNVYTEPFYRRRGISETLMKILLADARKSNLDYVELTATEDGYPLYKKLGFHEEIPATKPMKLIINSRKL